MSVEEIGIAPNTSGYRAVVVCSVPATLFTLRNSGSICRNKIRDGSRPRLAGFTGVRGSISATAPPVPYVRALNWPVGKPNPCVLRFDWARAASGTRRRVAAIRTEVCIITATRSWFAARR
jgi:hypothetical protein